LSKGLLRIKVCTPPLMADPVIHEKPVGHFADRFCYPLPLHKLIVVHVYPGVF